LVPIVVKNWGDDASLKDVIDDEELHKKVDLEVLEALLDEWLDAGEVLKT
jgi:hypothetical protein